MLTFGLQRKALEIHLWYFFPVKLMTGELKRRNLPFSNGYHSHWIETALTEPNNMKYHGSEGVNL